MSVYEKFIAAAAQDAAQSVFTAGHMATLDRLFGEYSQYRTAPTTFRCNTGIVFFDIPEDRVFRELDISSFSPYDLREHVISYWKKAVCASDGAAYRVFVSNDRHAFSVVMCTDPDYVFTREHLMPRDGHTYPEK